MYILVGETGYSLPVTQSFFERVVSCSLSVDIIFGFDANLLKLLSASVVAIFLAVPYWKGKYFSKPAAKKANKEGAKNA